MTTHFFGDTAVLLGRSMRHITRSLDTVLTVAIMPIALMLMFVSSSAARSTRGRSATWTTCCPGSC